MIELAPIGIVRSPFATPLDAPRQGFFTNASSVLEIEPRFAPALAGLEEGHEVLVLFFAHLANRAHLQSPGGTGAFAGRSLHRPNPIGVSTCRIVKVETTAEAGPRLTVTGLDAVDGSPLLDLKPAHPEWEGNLPILGSGALSLE